MDDQTNVSLYMSSDFSKEVSITSDALTEEAGGKIYIHVQTLEETVNVSQTHPNVNMK